MVCRHVPEFNAIVCGRLPRRALCHCGRAAPYLCDWKIGPNRTCDLKLCDRCVLQVADDKHLCPDHGRAWAKHPRNPARSAS